MTIQLTEEQQEVLDASGPQPPEVVDPRTNSSYVLVRVDEYEAVREILEDERQQAAIRAVALKNAVGRMNEPR
jgi:hypothetical protein